MNLFKFIELLRKVDNNIVHPIRWVDHYPGTQTRDRMEMRLNEDGFSYRNTGSSLGHWHRVNWVIDSAFDRFIVFDMDISMTLAGIHITIHTDNSNI